MGETTVARRGSPQANPQNAVSSAAGHFDAALARARNIQRMARGSGNPSASSSPQAQVRYYEAASRAAETFRPGERVEYSNGSEWVGGSISFDNAVRVDGNPLETSFINSLRRVGETNTLISRYRTVRTTSTRSRRR